MMRATFPNLNKLRMPRDALVLLSAASLRKDKLCKNDQYYYIR